VEASSIQPPPSGNNGSTGTSPVPPIHQPTRSSTNDRRHTPHLVARTITTGTRTKHPVSVRVGQRDPAANCRCRTAARGLWLTQCGDVRRDSPRPNRALSGSRAWPRPATRRVSSLRCGPRASLSPRRMHQDCCAGIEVLSSGQRRQVTACQAGKRQRSSASVMRSHNGLPVRQARVRSALRRSSRHRHRSRADITIENGTMDATRSSLRRLLQEFRTTSCGGSSVAARACPNAAAVAISPTA
jgi:hypothetical protein